MAAHKLDIGWSPQHPFFGYFGPTQRKYAEKIHIICGFIKTSFFRLVDRLSTINVTASPCKQDCYRGSDEYST